MPSLNAMALPTCRKQVAQPSRAWGLLVLAARCGGYGGCSLILPHPVKWQVQTGQKSGLVLVGLEVVVVWHIVHVMLIWENTTMWK